MQLSELGQRLFKVDTLVSAVIHVSNIANPPSEIVRPFFLQFVLPSQ